MDNLTAHKASEYDQKVRQTIPFFETLHAKVTRVVKLIKPEVKRWVDTGCGTGRRVEQALRHSSAAHSMLADPSEALLEQARPRLSNHDRARLTILSPIESGDLGVQIAKNAVLITAMQCPHYKSTRVISWLTPN